MKPLKIYTEMDIQNVYIIMGLNCNFNCKYCYEKSIKDIYSTDHACNELISYLKRLVKIKPFVEEKPINILFWGGEPLLYLNIIKDIVEKLKGLPFKYSTVTNGILFTKEIVDYFNKNNIAVFISNDGVQTEFTRGINVLEDNKKLELFKN